MKYLSPLLSEASGAVAGLVASHNRGGQYFRARVTPTDPLTTRQAETRANMAALVNLWKSITPAQRASWDLYGSNVPVTNTLGQTIHLTGQQMFIRSNTVRLQLGQTAIADGPSIFNLGEPATGLSEFTFDGGSGAIVMTWQLSVPASAAGIPAVWAGRPQNLSRNFYKGPYQLADQALVSATDTTVGITATIGTDWTSEYVPSLTTQMPSRVRIMYGDGRLTAPFEIMAVPIAPTT